MINNCLCLHPLLSSVCPGSLPAGLLNKIRKIATKCCAQHVAGKFQAHIRVTLTTIYF